MWTKTFDSFDSFIDYAETAPSAMPSRTSRELRRAEWLGSNSFAEALQQARKGWDGAKDVKDIVSQIELTTLQAVCRPEVVYDVIGESIDVGVFCEGRPDCWMDTVEGDEPRTDEGEAITLQVNLGAPGTVKPEAITTRGAALVALVSGLEQAGKRVRVIGVSEVESKGDLRVEHARIVVELKADGEAMDIDRMAFALASPSMLRRMIWSVRETAPYSIRQPLHIVKSGDSYGRAVPHIDALINNSIVFDRIEPTEHWTPQSAKYWVMGILNQLGVQTGDGADGTRLRPDYDAPVYQEARAKWEAEHANDKPVTWTPPTPPPDRGED